MTKKQPLKPSAPPPAAPPPRVFTSVLVAALLVALAAGGTFWYLRSGSASADVASAASSQPSDAAQASTTPESTGPPANAKFGPHTQVSLPPLAFPGYPTPRPPEVVRAAYTFAAEHPEVLGYVPCFCGCQREGHRGNDDCFVAARAANGDVTTWEPHGMECQICIDVAHKSEEMHKAGASVKQIRDTIDQTWSSRYPVHTPTPPVPKGGG